MAGVLAACAVPQAHEAQPTDAALQIHGEQPVIHAPGTCKLCDVYFHSLDYVVRIKAGDSLGAGVIVDSKGTLVTNAHVVGTSTVVSVQLYDDSTYVASVLRSDPVQDLAVLQIEHANRLWLPVDLSPTAPPRVGSEVFVVGHPFGLSWTVSRGIVSAYRRPGEISLVDYVQTDASISPGNSGGPMLDESGHLIGIVTSKLVDKEVDNVAFARPAAAVLAYLRAE